MKEIKDVLAVCRRHKTFLLVSHANPDADAAASVLAMAVFLKSWGKKVHVLNEDALPQWLRFLPQAKLFKKASAVKALDYDAALVLDCGDLKRIGAVQKFLRPGRPIVNIDHHVTNDRFGTVRLIIPKASSTCEIVFEIITAAGVSLNKALSVLLYAGIMTDTGSFRFENTGGRTHAIAAALMHCGLNADELYRELYVGIPVKDLKSFVDLVRSADLLLAGKVYCVSLPKKVLAKFSPAFDLKERLFGFLRSVNGIEVVVILTELGPKETRINLRSQGKFDVAKLAVQFNGGGHKKAAGAKSTGNLKETHKQIIRAIAQKI